MLFLALTLAVDTRDKVMHRASRTSQDQERGQDSDGNTLMRLRQSHRCSRGTTAV